MNSSPDEKIQRKVITVTVDEIQWNSFQVKVAEIYGLQKGAQGVAVDEAISLFLEKHPPSYQGKPKKHD